MDKMGHIEKSVLESADVVKKLGDNSQQIGQIVDTIAAIAEQTNLLALNAAIEAARAGEHAKQALAFQVLFIFVVIVFMALGAMAFDIESGVWIGVVIPSLIWFVLAIVAVFKALTGQLFIYPGLQPFTKKPCNAV